MQQPIGFVNLIYPCLQRAHRVANDAHTLKYTQPMSVLQGRMAAPNDIECRTARVSIIICTHARLTELALTLASLALQRVPSSWCVGLYVVENGEPSGVETLVRSFKHPQMRARYLHERIACKSGALNRAIAEADGDLLLFTDDDVRFPPGWITAMCTPLLEDRGSVVVGGCVIAPHLQREWLTRYHRGFLASTEYLSRDNPSEFAGVNMACLRSLFTAGFRFDCNLGGGALGNGEDTLLALQWKEAGVPFVARTDLCVEHHFAPRRFERASWIAAARDRGRSQAYINLHWHHETERFCRLKLLFFSIKLHTRRLVSRSFDSQVPASAWELSYCVDIARLSYTICHRDDRPIYHLGVARSKPADARPLVTTLPR